MPSTYTLNNGIELIGTGEQSGTWGDTTNTNLELLDTALDGQVTVTLSSTGSGGSPNTLPISDGSSSNGRNRLVVFNDGSDIGGTVYVQLTPNDAEKIIYVRNSLSGSRSILLFQGTYNASNDYEIPAGTTAIVFFNGGGTGAVAANVFNNAYFDGLRLGSVSVDKILDEDNMASNDAAALATQQSIKAYVDTQVGANNELSEVLANGNTSGGTAIQMTTTDELQFRDTALKISSSADGQLDIDADTEIEIVAPTVDIDASTAMTIDTAAFTVTGAVDFNTSLNVDGTVTADGLTVDGLAKIQGTATGLVINETDTTDLNTYFNSNAGDFNLMTTNDAFTSFTTRLNVDHSTGDITFFDTSGNASFVYDESAGSTFNEQGADRDFRVESDNQTHMLFVDAGEDAVKIGGTTTREGALQVFTTASGVAMEIESTNASASQGPILQLRRTSASPAGNDYLGALNFVGQDSGNNALAYVDMYTRATTVTDGSEESQLSIRTRRNGTLEERVTLDAVETTFNEVGGNIDFRVESDNNTHALFVDAGSNHVNIGTSSDFGGVLNVNGTIAMNGAGEVAGFFDLSAGITHSGDNVVAFSSGTSGSTQHSSVALWADDHSQYSGQIHIVGNTSNGGSVNSAGEVEFWTFNGSSYTLEGYMGPRGYVFNEASRNVDFRVESDNNANMLFVDAGNDHVNIGSSTDRGGLLNVDGTTKGIVVRTTNSAAMELIHADNGAGTGPIMYLNRPSSGPAADDQLGRIVVQGKNSADEVIDYVRLVNQLLSPTDGSEQGRFAINTMTSGTQNSRLNIVNGESVFNDESVNVDFRVESDSVSNMLLVDAGDDTVYIGTNSNVFGSADNYGMNFFNGGIANFSTNDASIHYWNIENLSTTRAVVTFYATRSSVGNISINTSGTTYNTTSDRRLKDNIEPIADGTEKLMAMNPVSHTWKADPEADAVHGFIAQEMHEIVPEAVSGEPDGEEMMSMDYGRITPVLVAALQDAHNKITALEKRLAEMEIK